MCGNVPVASMPSASHIDNTKDFITLAKAQGVKCQMRTPLSAHWAKVVKCTFGKVQRRRESELASPLLS